MVKTTTPSVIPGPFEAVNVILITTVYLELIFNLTDIFLDFVSNSTLQMLTNIENRLEELFESIETMPPEKVEAAEKVWTNGDKSIYPQVSHSVFHLV